VSRLPEGTGLVEPAPNIPLQKGCDGIVYQGHLDRMTNDRVYREQQLRNRVGDDTMPISAEKAIELLAAFGVIAALSEFADAGAVGFPIVQPPRDYSYTLAAFFILIGFIFGWAANTAFNKARNWLKGYFSKAPVPKVKDEAAEESDDYDNVPIHLTALGRSRTRTVPQVNRSVFEMMPAKCHYYSTGKAVHLYKECNGNFQGTCQPVGFMPICLHCRRQYARNVASDTPDDVSIPRQRQRRQSPQSHSVPEAEVAATE
jgi:hypothetical protein